MESREVEVKVASAHLSTIYIWKIEIAKRKSFKGKQPYKST